jgi:hypothetical protein
MFPQILMHVPVDLYTCSYGLVDNFICSLSVLMHAPVNSHTHCSGSVHFYIVI